LEGGLERAPAEAKLMRAEVELAVVGIAIFRHGNRRQMPAILAAIFQHAADVFLSKADRDLDRLVKLVGRRVMVEKGYGDSLLLQLMREEGIATPAVQFVPHSYSLEELVNDKVDVIHAYATVEPGLLQRRGIATRMISPVDYGIVFYGDMLATRQEYVVAQAEVVAAARRASLKGWDWALKHVDEVASYILSLPGVSDRGIDREFLLFEARNMQSLIRADIIPLGHINPSRWDHMAHQLVQMGVASDPPAYETWVYRSDQAVHPWWLQTLLLGWLLLLGVLAVLAYSRKQLREIIRRRTATLENEVRQRLQTESVLRASEKQFASLFWENPECLTVTRRLDGKMLLVNKSFATLFESTRDQIEGRTSIELGIWLSPEDREQVIEALKTAGTLRSYETLLRTLQGRVFPALVSVVPYEYQTEDCLLWIILDISQQKRQEEERRRYEMQVQHVQRLESLGIMAGGIAHDFNNLLTGILGNIELLNDELADVPACREPLQDVRAAATRASELTRQLLAYSGRGRSEDRPLEVNTLIQETVQLLKLSISKKAVLRLDLAAEGLILRGDVSQLRQVLMNLVMNASDALDGRPGEIRIASGLETKNAPFLSEFQPGVNHPAGSYVCIEVRDTGCGIDESLRQKIFEPFFTTKFTGRGLGLAAVLGIVRGHRGALSIESAPGKGTTVRVLLPATNDVVENETRVRVAQEERSMEQQVILVADDEELVRKLAKAMLGKAGYEVIVVEDGVFALEELRRRAGKVDLVILDMTMPRLSGDETFRAIQKEFPGMKVIVASGYTEGELVESFADGKPVGFLGKPFEKDELLSKVTEALAS
ncbi:MAG TPA: ABC transporter substrate-binding protein, partial [Candidatus Ozemobacteraceae bacterium]|nr:ABC transporter substrate-binding protein [Candidatus Ozemobacteraceae bacterium]